jgi:hypothetical protein
MSEPNRIPEETITTADLAARAEERRQAEGRPSLLRNERRIDSEPTIVSRSREEQELSDRPTPPKGAPIPLTRGDDIEAPSGATPADDQPAALFSEAHISDFRSRWSDIQTGFVDEPRQSVESADSLVASLMQKLAEGFAGERDRLEKQWDRGDEVSTEDLRIALRRYRSFFDRLLRV